MLQTGLVGHLAALAVGRGNGRRAGKLHAQRLGQRVHGGGGAHRVAIAGRGRRRGHEIHEFLIADLAGRKPPSRFPHDGARAGALAVVPAVEHRADRQRDRRHVDRGRRHQQRRRGLVAADGEHHAVERIAVEHLDQRQVGEVAVERGRRPLAGFLDRVARKFERDAAGRLDAGAHALGQFEMMPVAGRQVRAGLGDADDRLAGLQFGPRQPVVQITLQIECRHPGVVRVIEPLLGAQAPPFRATGHGFPPEMIGTSDRPSPPPQQGACACVDKATRLG